MKKSLLKHYYNLVRLILVIFILILLSGGLFQLYLMGYSYFSGLLRQAQSEAGLIADKHYSVYLHEIYAEIGSFDIKGEVYKLRREILLNEIRENSKKFPGLVVEENSQSPNFIYPNFELNLKLYFSKSYQILWFLKRASILVILVLLFSLLYFYIQKRYLRSVRKAFERITQDLSTKSRLSLTGFEEIDALVNAINLAMDRERELTEKIASQQKMIAIGTMAGGYAHEFNNLLQIIASQLELMEHDVVANDCTSFQHHLRKAREGLLRGQRLSKKILQLATVTETETTNLTSFLRDFEETLRVLVPREINLELNLPTEDLWVEISEENFKEVLVNLITNAIDALNERAKIEPMFEKRIELKLEKEDDLCVLKIKDTGIGMKEEIKSRVFEPFFTTKEVGKGTGLGLYIVYNVIKNIKGSIELESTPLKGTTFKITLPLAKYEILRETPKEEALPKVRKLLYKKILVVDDEEDIRDALAEFLELHHVEVHKADKATTAYEMIQRENFDLCMVDLFMPEKGGDWLIEKLKEIKPPITKIVVMTGYAGELEERVKKAQEEGLVIKILRKPFSLQEIEKIIYKEE